MRFRPTLVRNNSVWTRFQSLNSLSLLTRIKTRPIRAFPPRLGGQILGATFASDFFTIVNMFKSLAIGLRLLIMLSFCGLTASGQRYAHEREEWNKPFKPFRIAGNLYYVGATGVSAFLITTTEGSILIDGGLPETAPLIEKNISDLGFKITDIKYLLNSHAHFDHAGGLAELQRLSGAQMIASAGDSQTLRTGIDTVLGPSGSFPAIKIDRVISDNDTVQLGGMTLTAHLTPGHTRGSTTWTTRISENGKTYRVLFHSSTTVAANKLVNNHEYPNIISDYEASFAKFKKLSCDIFLAPHGSFFHLTEKLKKRAANNSNPFIDPNELQRFVNQSEMDFKRELREQKSKSERPPQN
ncbi:MAG: subclass metallo-beta-lactamase [Verrucomicrobiales bacterium]|nr:subclass metallo-beta-lactamase [Verrucomicrobiales bacterium]